MVREGIAVDGGCSGNPGKAYYRGVDIATGRELFRCDIGVATNNIAEFLAICHGIHYVLKHNLNDIPVYSDSQTAIKWAKNQYTNSSFKHPRVKEAEKFLQTVNKPIRVLKWDTRTFGEIPADFGYKK